MTHAAGGRENRLARESSPYLLLHKDNPVDWYPWGPEALAKARREGKPIFLSVGYSTCYWCHVMERESFSDAGVAELMNRSFVSIKVDREERPDLDEIYMTATQILTQHGGWPNSVWLTPDLEPFYAGTYFPPEDRYGRPGFATVLRGLAEAWAGRRVEVEQQAEELAAAVRRVLEERVRPGAEPPSAAVAARARDGLARSFDETWGGFGGAPKFPSPSNLFLLQELAARGDAEAGKMLAATLDRMARGGLYDQLGGGFHRYATDRQWRVPHFEKMLYDNAHLLALYAREHARTGDPEAARIARETAEWVRREMTSPEGAFWSAIDAETEGEEGAFYVWSREQLTAALGEQGFAFAAPLLGFDGAPFFEGERWVLHLPAPLAEQAAARGIDPALLLVRLAGPKGKLFEARAVRERPLTDDKVLADWNGMMIAGLADAGRLLGDPELTARAARAARFVLAELWVAPADGSDGEPDAERDAGAVPAGSSRGPGAGGEPDPDGNAGAAAAGSARGLGGGGEARRILHHAWRGGNASVPAFLADYAFLVRGLLALDRATGEPEWLDAARALTAEQIARLRSPDGGFFVAAESPDLLFRSQDPFDGAIPSANAVAALDLLDLAAATGEARWREEARATLAAFAPLVESFPDGSRMLALAALRWRDGAEERAAAEAGAAAGGAVAAVAREAESAVAVSARFGAPDEGGWRPFTVRLEIAGGWHVNANPASREFLIPTAVEAAGGELRAVAYPAGERFRFAFADDELEVYGGAVEIPGELRAGEGVRLRVTYQACDDERCLPPVVRELAVP